MKRICYSTFLVFSLLLVFGLTDASAQRRNRQQAVPTTGRLSVKTMPAAYPVLVNGKPWGLSGNPNPNEVDLSPGTYLVEIQFPKKSWTREIVVNAGRRSCICLTYNERVLEKFCPYDLRVDAPSEVTDGDLITFSSSVNYGGPTPLAYRWTVSPESARITSGQGTPSITVDTTGLAGQSVTARLESEDTTGDPSCRADNSATVPVRPPPPPPPITCFDCFTFVAFDDVKARLDNFTIELANRPDYQAYIITYGRRGSRLTSPDRLGVRARDYLVRNRGIDPRRITIVNGGNKDRAGYDLYLLPPGANPPIPR
jgi:hypothetical protein